MALRQRENKPDIPVALVFYVGRAGIAREEYEEAVEEAVFGESILTFRYLQISLPLLRAEDYVQAEQVLRAGLASVMQLPRDRQALSQLHLACLRRVLEAEQGGKVNAAQAFLLGNLVATYLPLPEEEREALQVQWQQEGGTGMEPTTLEGAQQLFRENSMRTRREDIRHLVQLRFGYVMPEIDVLIAATWTEDGLRVLFDRAAVAQNKDELLRPFDGAPPWRALQLFRDNSLRTRREDIKRLVQLRFGRVSSEVDALIAATKTEGGLMVLFERAMVAQNEDELLRPPDDAQP